MPISPTEAITVSTPRVGMIPCFKEAYQADLRRRFGKIPSWSELARLESEAMRTRVGKLAMIGRDLSDAAREKLAALRRADGERTNQAVLTAINQPMTKEDIMAKTGLAASTVVHALIRAKEAGLVTREIVNRLAVWSRVEVAG